jgi:hypothetical protein
MVSRALALTADVALIREVQKSHAVPTSDAVPAIPKDMLERPTFDSRTSPALDMVSRALALTADVAPIREVQKSHAVPSSEVVPAIPKE